MSGIGVGPVFKGVKQFDTAALEFDILSFSLSYHYVQAPSHCLKSGCSKCSKIFFEIFKLFATY